jgi:ParB family chromosome partitioning protein
MNAKKKRLGRGLDALLSKPVAETAAVTGGGTDGPLKQVPVELLQRGQFQPRIDMRQDSLEDLANSIKAQGAIIREVGDDDAIAMALIENIQRENLNPLEEARALDRLIREFDLTHAEAAEAVGRSRAAVSNLLRLQDLSAKVKGLLEAREIEMGHARALLSIENAVQQLDLARQVVRKGLSVRETERLVKRMLDASVARKPARKAAGANADIRRLEVEVSEKLGAKVSLQHTQKGSGKLVITYNSLDELDGILKHIR